MSTKTASYLKNVSKSIGYSMIGEIKKSNPAISAFAQTNSEVMKGTYHAITHLKSTASNMSTKLLDSKYGELGKTAIDNVKEDLRSGKFYNMERKQADMEKATSTMGGMDGDFGNEFAGIDLSMDGDIGLDTGESMESMMDLVGKKSSEAVSQTIIRTSEYAVNANAEMGRAIAGQQKAIYANLHAGMGTINQNLAKMIEFSNGPVTTHMENSKTFYETETTLSQERNSILKELLDIQKNMYKKQDSSSNKTTMSSITDEYGIPDIATYFDRIKENVQNLSAGTGDMVKELFESGTINTMISSPLEALTSGIAKVIIPNALKATMKSFNSTISGVFTTTMAKLANTESTNPIFNMFKNILGVNDTVKKDIDTGKYEKGAVPFDGIVRKSIVEVIPTHLARIEAALTKGPERRYDYQTGKFMSMKDVKGKLGDVEKTAKSTANADVDKYIQQYMGAINFGDNKNRKKELEENIKQILDSSFNKNMLYNPKDKKSAKSLGLTGGNAENDLKIIRKMFEALPKDVFTSYSAKAYDAKDSITRTMNQKERDGDDITNALFNNSMPEEINRTAGTNTKTDTSGKSNVRGPRTAGKNRNKRNQQNKKKTTSSTSDDSAAAAEAGEIIFSDTDIDSIADRASVVFAAMGDDSNKTTGKSKKFLDRLNNLLHKPSDFLAGIIKKADTSLYNMVFGIEYDEDGQQKSVSAAIFDGLKAQFKDFGDWMKKTIYNPIKKWFNEEGTFGNKVKKKFQNVFKSAGDSKFGTRMKDEFKSIGKDVKNSAKEVGGSVLNKLNSANGEKSKTKEVLNAIKGIGSVENAASGMKRVKKTGVVAVSEGEMIIPPDMNPYNIDKRTKKEDKAKNSFITSLLSNGIPGFAEGGVVGSGIADQFMYIYKKDPEKAKALLKKMPKEEQAKIKIALKKQEASEILTNTVKSVGNTIKSGATSVGDAINRGRGKDTEAKPSKMTEGEEGMITEAFSAIKKYAPEVSVGALLGTGVSFITGAIGGPLLGAAVGGGLSLIKHSERVQEMLFGEKDEDGKRQGNLLSKDLSQNLQKYVPSIGKGATLGAITSILPFVPGGPVAGIVIGSAAGFASKNEAIQERLFGEEGLLGKDFATNVKKALPNMGIGAVAGAITGPFGVATNMILGSAAGYVTSTDKFKDLVFGKEDKDGKRTGGVIESAVLNMFKPLADFAKDTTIGLIDWADKNIKKPLADAVDPLKKQFKLMMSSISKQIHSHLDKFFIDRLGAPFDTFLKDKIFKPVASTVKKVMGIALAPIKAVVKAPFTLVGAIGEHYRTKQIKGGNADYMTADQRLAYRKEKGKRKFPNVSNESKRFNKYDNALSDMGAGEAKDLSSKIGYALNAEKQFGASTKDAYSKFDKKVRHNKKLSAGQIDAIAKRIRKSVEKDGDVNKASKSAHKYIASLEGLSDDDRKQLASAVDEYLASIKEAKSRKGAFAGNKQKLMNALQQSDTFKNAGIKDIKEEDLPKLVKYLEAEAKAKTVNADGLVDDSKKIKGGTLPSLNEEQQKRHDQTIDALGQINKTLSILVNPNSADRASMYEELSSSFDGVNDKANSKRDKRDSRNAKLKVFKTNLGSNIKGSAGYKATNGAWTKWNGDKNVDWHNVNSSSVASEGEEIDESDSGAKADSSMFDRLKERANNVKSKNKKFVYTFVNGKAIKMRRADDGELIVDKSDSQTSETLDDIEDEKLEKKNLLTKLTDMPKNLFEGIKKAFGGEDEDSESKKKGILQKLIEKFTGGGDKEGGRGGAIASGIAAVIGIPLLAGLFKDHVLPAIQPGIDAIKPAITSLGDRLLNWFTGEGDSAGKGLPGLIKVGIEHWATGFEWIATNVLPKVAEISIKALPGILAGLLKGFSAVMKENFHNVFSAGRPSTAAEDAIDKDIKSGSKIKMNIIGSNNANTPFTYGGYSENSAWSDITSQFKASDIDLSAGSITNINTGAISTEAAKDINKKYDEKVKNGDVSSYKDTKAYKGLSDPIKEKLDSQISALEKDNKNIISIPGKDGADPIQMTIQELLTSDTVVAEYPDENGEIVKLTGKQILNNPSIAADLGVSSLDLSLSEDERQKNKEKRGEDQVDSLGSMALGLGTKKFLRGAGGKTALSGIGKAVGKIPLVGKLVGWPLRGIDSASGLLGKLGEKILPAGFRQGSKVIEKDAAKIAAEKAAGKATKKAAEKAVKNTVGNVAKEATEDAVGKTAKDVVKNSGDDMLGAMTKRAQKDAVGTLGEATEKAAKSSIGQAAKTVTKEASEEAVEKGAKTFAKNAAKSAATENKGFIAKALAFAKNKLQSLFQSKIIKNNLGKAVAESGKEATEEAVEKYVKALGKKVADKLIPIVGEKLGKSAAKVITNIGLSISTGGIAKAGFIVAAFLSGWNNANSVIGTVDSVSEPTGMTKFACAMVNALNESVCFGLLPLDLIFDMILPILKTVFKVDTSKLEKDREESADVVKAYNEKHGTNLTVEEYNKKDRITTKIAKGAKDIGGKAVDGIKDAAGWVKDKATGIGKAVAKGAETVYTGVVDFGKSVGGIVSDAFKYATYAENQSASEKAAKETDKKNPLAPVNRVFSGIMDTVFGPLRMINTVGRGVVKIAKTIMEFGGKVIQQVKIDAEQGEIDFKKGDFKNFFRFNETEVDGEGNEFHNPLSPFRTIIKSTTRLVQAPILAIQAVGDRIKKGISNIIQASKYVFDRVKTAGSEAIDIAKNGSLGDYFVIKGEMPDSPLGWLDRVMTSTTRLVLSPVTAVIGTGRVIKKGIDTVVQGAKTVFNTINNSEAIEIAKNGSLTDYFNITDNSMNTPFGWLNTAIAGAQRLVLSPIAAIIGAGRIIKSGVGNVIEGGKMVFSNIKGAADRTMQIAKTGSIGEYFNIADNDLNTPFGWMNTAITGVTRFVLAPVAAATAVGTKIGDFVKDVIKDGKVLAKNIAKNSSSANAYADKDNLTGYWDYETNSSGFFGAIEKVVSSIDRIFKWPILMMQQTMNKVVDFIKKPIDKIKSAAKSASKKFKEIFGMEDDDNYDDKGTSTTTGVSSEIGNVKAARGSNLVPNARGSNSQPHSDPKYKDDSTFISQLDTRYATTGFNINGDKKKQTLADSGCGPAAAAMVVNDAYKSKKLDMRTASKNALDYKVQNGGVSAAYFEDEFSKNGLSTDYIMDGSQEQKSNEITNKLRSGNKVVLMGKDPSNKSKAVSPYGPNDHYIVATRMSDDGKYVWVNDPESKVPEIKYPAAQVLNKSSMGIAGIAASGSGLVRKLTGPPKRKGDLARSLRSRHARGSYGSDTVQYKVWTRLRGAGMTEIQAAGIMGNIQAESGFDPAVVEGGSGIGFGLCQWSFGRRTQIENYAAASGKSASDVDTQLDFLIAECNPGGGCDGYANYQLTSGGPYEGRMWDGSEFQNATDVDTATKAFCYTWERPNAAYAHMDNRISAANTYLQEFAGIAGDSSSSSSSGESKSAINTVLDTLNVFDDLAAAYGLKAKSDSSSSSSGNSSGGNANVTADQQGLVNKMKTVEGKLAYSWDNRDPDTGSGDCSSTVQWAYKNVLGVDPGSWTGAQETDEDLTTVADNVNDESKLAPGDLIMYRTGGASTHVEMYAGDGQMIGHGGGADGSTPGPTVKPLQQNFGGQIVSMVRRANQFAGSGSGLVDRISGRASGLQPDKIVKIGDTLKRPGYKHSDNNGFLRKSRYTKDMHKNVEIPAGMFAGGSDMDSETIDTNYKLPTISAINTPKPKAMALTGGSDTKVTAYLSAMLKLLAKEVENTSMLSTIISILTELVKISEEERAIDKSSSTSNQQRSALESRRIAMLNVLKSTGVQSGPGNELTKLIADAEKLARI